MRETKRFIVALVLCCLPILAEAQAPATLPAEVENLVSNGDFRNDRNKDGWPDDWPRAEGATWEQEGETRFVQMKGLGEDKMPTLYRVIRLKPEVKALQLKLRARATDVVVGREKYHDARIIMHFKSGDGRELYPEPQLRTYSGSTRGWVSEDILFMVPAEAVSLQFIPAMFNCKSGTFDLTDIELRPIDPKAIELRRIGSAINEPVPAVTDLRSGPMPGALKVAGNVLQDAEGKAVVLRGINVGSLEASAEGQGVLRSIRIATGEWKANVIRLPVSDQLWFGKGAGQGDGGAAYRALVDAAVQLAANQGAYTVLELHREGAADQACVEFWTAAGARYKDHPAVLPGLFSDPAAGAWAAWRDGGAGGAAGMQALVNAIRRAGANNVVFASGVAKGQDLSGIGNGYALSDSGAGRGIGYEIHVAPRTGDWEKALPLAEKYVLFVSECGVDPRQSDFLAVRPEYPYVWAPALLAKLQQRKLNWTASWFSPQTPPRLIDTWQYEPTPFWGAFVRVALSGGKFGGLYAQSREK